MALHFGVKRCKNTLATAGARLYASTIKPLAHRIPHGNRMALYNPEELSSPPELLVIGHVARDFIGSDVRLGGAASFASRAAACLGVHTALVTAAPWHFDLLNILEDTPSITVLRIDSPEETGFALDYSGPIRKIHLRSRALDITPQHIPAALRNTPVAYIAPVIGECGNAVIQCLTSPSIVVGAQGWLRTVNPEGLLIPTQHPDILQPSAKITAMVFSELDHPSSEDIARTLAQHIPLVALTRGSQGVTLFTPKATPVHIPAAPAVEIDPTGAGDVFGIVLGLSLHKGMPFTQAAEAAVYAAARVVEGPGLGNLVHIAKPVVAL
jgi:1D-myo-inositol 3-kinase